MIRSLERKAVLVKTYLNKTGIDQSLVLSCFFSVLLLFARVIYTRELMFGFLVWNLFLAYLPYKLSCLLMQYPQWIERQRKFLALFVLWLLVLPNTFYILTDLFHLRMSDGIPLWFDLALIISFAWNGLLMGIISIRKMEIMLKLHWSFNNEWIYIYPVMFLNALGIYIGRYLRFNSWDVITNPFQLATDIGDLLIHPIRNRFDWSMIICYSLLLSLFYVTFKKVKEHQ